MEQIKRYKKVEREESSDSNSEKSSSSSSSSSSESENSEKSKDRRLSSSNNKSSGSKSNKSNKKSSRNEHGKPRKSNRQHRRKSTRSRSNSRSRRSSRSRASSKSSRNSRGDKSFISSINDSRIGNTGNGANGFDQWNPRRSRSSSESDLSSLEPDRSRMNADNTLSNITQRLFTPTKSGNDPARRTITRDNSRSRTPRSFRVEVDNDTAKRVKKSNEQYTATGPPKLPEIVNLTKFHEWQNNLVKFVERLPGYVNGMLTQRPDWGKMSRIEQEYMRDIYINIHGWLAKAGGENSKVTAATKGIKTYPYPDIVRWWSAVNDIYAISNTEIDRKVTHLHTLYQFPTESSRTYYTRFQGKYTELLDLGKELHDEEIGLMIFKGLTPTNKRLLHPFMANHNLNCTLSNMSKLCKYADEMDEDPNPNTSLVIPPAVTFQANLATNNDAQPDIRSIYGTVNNRYDRENRNSNGNYSRFNNRRQQNNRGRHQHNYRPNNQQSNNANNYVGEYQGYQRQGDERTIHFTNSSNDYSYQQSPNNGAQDLRMLHVHPDRRNNIRTSTIQSPNNFAVPNTANNAGGLSYEMMSNGNLAWFMNGREIAAPTDNNSNGGANHLKRSLDTMEQDTGPRRQPNARGAIDENRNQRMRSDSNLAANLVTEVNDLITPYDYCLGYPDFLDYYVDQLSFLNAEQRSWFPDYLGRYFDMIEAADAEWGQDDYAERYGDYISPYNISEKYLVDMSRVYVCALTTIVTDGSNTKESTSNTATQSTVSTTAVTSEAIAQLDFSTIIANLRQFSLNPDIMSRVGEAEMELIRGVYELVQSKSTDEKKEEEPIERDTNNESHDRNADGVSRSAGV